MRSWRSAAMKVIVRQWPSPRAPAMGPDHVGLGPGLIDEDKPRWIDLALIPLPTRAAPGHVRSVLLAGVYGFF